MNTMASASVTLEEVIPLVNRPSKSEQEALGQILQSKARIDWMTELEMTVAYFHQAFAQFPVEEVEADFAKALSEVRSGQMH